MSPMIGSKLGCRVLVVDDEANAREALVELLREEGYTAFAAASGEEALRRLADLIPDVVLTDFQMMGMNGLELAKAIHAASPARVAIMSAFPPPRPVALPWLAKPLDLDALFRTVESLRETS